MSRARELARLGAGRTWTNPMVGAVVVRDGEVVASAYHRRLGEAHAETLVLAAAGNRARGATLYVSLEPCAHHGHTPPCVESVLAAGIERVVIPAPDPDARVAGLGIETLRARGVHVDVGCGAAHAILDNHGYYHDRLGMARTVTLKIATSLDYKVSRAPGQRDRITGDPAQLDTHRLRAVQDAIVIGATTARVDRPLLDCRLLEAGVDHEPAIVVFDTELSLASDATWPAPGRDYVVVCRGDADESRARMIEARGGRVVRCRPFGRLVDVNDALEKLGALGFRRILVEGGAHLMMSFVMAQAWDALWHYQSHEQFGPGGVGVNALPTWGLAVDEMPLGDDTRRRYVHAASWERLTAALGERTSTAAGRTNDVHGHR